MANSMLTLDDIKAAAELVHSQINPTPQIAWPLLSRAIGKETWVNN